MYQKELYQNHQRFHTQYEDIHAFLVGNADIGINEHFHWGRFRWHMGHSLLDTDKLTTITIFRGKNREVCGLVTYDTDYADRSYILHNGDRELVERMIDHFISMDDNHARFVVNSRDNMLEEVLSEKGFCFLVHNSTVLQISLDRDFVCPIPPTFHLTPENHKIDLMKYQMVIFKGFNHEDETVFEPWEDDITKLLSQDSTGLRVFITDRKEYCAHCGIWYERVETAYIEPVVTIPRCRGMGLGKAVVFEALYRVRKMGAKRAIVLSDQPFYYALGFCKSSDLNSWGEYIEINTVTGV